MRSARITSVTEHKRCPNFLTIKNVRFSRGEKKHIRTREMTELFFLLQRRRFKISCTYYCYLSTYFERSGFIFFYLKIE